MKKNVIRLFAGMLALACALALTACSGAGGSSSSEPSSTAPSSSAVETSSSQPESSQPESSPAEEEPSTAEEPVVEGDTGEDASNPGMYSSMEELVSAPEIQAQLEAMSTDELGVAVSGEGNKLIYTFTFSESMDGVDTETLKASLEAGLDTQASVFESIAGTLEQVVTVDNPVVVVIYQDSQGSEIYSREFSAE